MASGTLNFRFEIMDHPVATAALAATAVAQTLDAHTRGVGLQSLSMQGNIKLVGHPAIVIENVIADLNPLPHAPVRGCHAPGDLPESLREAGV